MTDGKNETALTVRTDNTEKTEAEAAKWQYRGGGGGCQACR